MVLTHVDLIEKLLHYNRASFSLLIRIMLNHVSQQLWSGQKTKCTFSGRFLQRTFIISIGYSTSLKYSKHLSAVFSAPPGSESHEDGLYRLYDLQGDYQQRLLDYLIPVSQIPDGFVVSWCCFRESVF